MQTKLTHTTKPTTLGLTLENPQLLRHEKYPSKQTLKINNRRRRFIFKGKHI